MPETNKKKITKERRKALELIIDLVFKVLSEANGDLVASTIIAEKIASNSNTVKKALELIEKIQKAPRVEIARSQMLVFARVSTKPPSDQ